MSEELPALYRAILDRVGALDACGQRTAANMVRAEATKIYSRSWDPSAKRRLEALLRKNSGDLVGQGSVGHGFRRPTIPAT